MKQGLDKDQNSTQPKNTNLRRKNLLWFGPILVGAIVFIAWLALLPYTLGSNTQQSLFTSLNEGLGNIGNTLRSSFSSVEQNVVPETIKVVTQQQAIDSNRQVATDPNNFFVINLPKNWSISSVSTGTASLLFSSSTIVFSYPGLQSQVLENATTTQMLVNGYQALLSSTTQAAQLVSQRPAGYVVVKASGANAAALIKTLIAEVHFIK